MAESVKVAVRVRPFNQREIDRGAKLIINMDGALTTIQNPDTPKEPPKEFTFDYSYQSHNGFEVDADGVSLPSEGSTYAGQRQVFDDLGAGVLANAFQGYNCSLFAYGQTGSGKSYSMVGYGVNKGIVPITCDELFKSIEKNTDINMKYQVTFSMLEIYNEQVRDLLSKDTPKGGLPVRQNPKLGYFYVQGLKKVPVGSYKEIDKRTEQGTANRTVASTNMNATSSRAHTVVTITFDQIIKQDGNETKKSSVINLVDLAGSERADSTGATGDRLKEGANINKSLSALGNVISALADLSMGKKKILVPYRDSVLTKLLQNALGGNSKTIMIAALSPADINYDETLGTLRYADRAKKIKNKAVVNESPVEKLIRELREENDRLKHAMTGGLVPGQAGLSPKELEKLKKEMEEELKAELLANQEAMGSWDERLKESQREVDTISPDVAERTRMAHLRNLNEDPMLSGVIFHMLKEDVTTIGRKDPSSIPAICLSGLSIVKNHAVITNEGGEFEIKPASTGAKVKVNGNPINRAHPLENKDRILFGSNHMYLFINPMNDTPPDVPEDVTWDFAQKEIAQVKGFATGLGTGLTKDQLIAQEQVLELLPLVSEVNAVSEELDKHKSFEVVLLSSMAQDPHSNREKSTTVMVKMKNLLNENTWLWERGKFMNRRFLIQELYNKFLDGEDVSSIQNMEDPFWEPTEDVVIGTANIFLQSLSYALDFDDKLSLTDYKGKEEGTLLINVIPCVESGQPLSEESFVDDPSDLIGKPFHFKVNIVSVEIIKSRFSKGIQCRYKMYNDTNYTETPMIENTLSPKFDSAKVFHFSCMTQEVLDFFDSGCITIEVLGRQDDTIDARRNKMTTKALRERELLHKSGENNRPTESGEQSVAQVKAELIVATKKYERLLSKEARIQELCRTWEAKPPKEKKFEGFYNAISAAAFSTGTKLKTRVQLLNRGISLMDKTYLGKKAEGKGVVQSKGETKKGSRACVLQ